MLLDWAPDPASPPAIFEPHSSDGKSVVSTCAELSAEFDRQLSCVRRAKMAKTKDDPVVEDVDDDEESDDDSDDVPELEEADGSGRGKQSKMEKKSRFVLHCLV